MAVTGNIYSSYIDNFLKNLRNEVHFTMSDGKSIDADTLFAKNAFDSIPDGSTINKVNIIFDGALSRDDTKYWKGSIKIYKVACLPTWDGVYPGYNNLPWSDKVVLWSGEFNTGDLPYHYKTYTHSVSGITLEQLRSGLVIQTSYKYVTWASLKDSDIYVRNFHVTVDYTPPVPYTITYDGNGATSGSVSSQSGNVGSNVTLNQNGFVKEYRVTFNPNDGLSNSSANSTATFKGWEDHGGITSSSGEAFTYQQFDAPYYANTHGDLKNAFGYDKLSLVDHYVGHGRNEGRSCTGSPRGVYPAGATVSNLAASGGTCPLYAQWSEMSAVKLPNPTRDGYTFLGWYTAASGGTKVGDGGTSYTPRGDITLYAQWRSNGVNMTWIGSKQPKFLLGVKPVLKIFKGTTVIYYNPFAGQKGDDI